MIKKIGIENFRVFKEYTEFNLAPITLLTGTNNSGKSSFLKLLDLLKSNFSTNQDFSELNFENGSHNLGTFDKVLNWDNDSKAVKIILDINLDYFDEDFKLELSYDLVNEKGKIQSFKIFNDNRVLFLMDDMSKREDFIDNTIDIKYLKKTYNENTICKEEENYAPKIIEAFRAYNKNPPFKKLTDSETLMRSMVDSFAESSFNLESAINDVIKLEGGTPKNLDRFNKVKNTIKLEDFVKEFYRKEYDVLVHKEFPLSYINKKEWIKNDFDEKTFDKFIIENEELFFNSIDKGSYSFSNQLQDDNPDNFVNNFFTEGYIDLETFYHDLNFELPQDDIHFKSYREGGNFLLNIEEDMFMELLSPFEDQVENFDKYFLKNIYKALKDIQMSFESINIISATRGNKNRILSNKSLNDIDAIAKEFKQTEVEEEEASFIESALTLLNIKGEIEIDRIEGVASVVYLKQGNKKVTLADLGYGYSQVIPILLKIILVNKNSLINSTIIIEEPEANLHPNLQSKLADVLVLAHKTFGLNFILESHSEYLIRKLQYLTAKKEITQDDVLIYYFNADEYVTETESKIKEIKIDQFGALTDSFGPGFFDEATSLKFELMKLNQAQNN